MNLSFLKLRVAGSPWIVVDAKASSFQAEHGWSRVAVSICDKAGGAFASGLVVVERSGSVPCLRAWELGGREVQPPPAALLCAARLLLDEGKGGADGVPLSVGGRIQEALVIDAGLLGLELGVPARSAARDAVPGFSLGVGADGGVSAAIDLGYGPVELTLFDRPRRRAEPGLRSRALRRVEALAVSRRELRVRPGVVDPVLAAGAAVAVAVAADFADRELEVAMGAERLVVQWPEGGPVFAAAAPRYCLSGEFWFDEALEPADA